MSGSHKLLTKLVEPMKEPSGPQSGEDSLMTSRLSFHVRSKYNSNVIDNWMSSIRLTSKTCQGQFYQTHVMMPIGPKK